ncbi:hypothetical protein VTN77DRAFT_2630 [Rasamsonia byssochlamydoides]|uniref:uncharacterized protein n=1 Tax=Rasamsonia byssochlamydoides TaxID=89139 RepID=UPI0037425AB0
MDPYSENGLLLSENPEVVTLSEVKPIERAKNEPSSLEILSKTQSQQSFSESSNVPDSWTDSSDGEVPIAIVGLSTRFPGGADSPEKLWDLISQGRSAWSEIPSERFNLDGFYHPVANRNGSTNVRGGHFLKEDVSLFDAPFFNISPNEAKAMDPQQRLQLESAYEALENAGIPLDKIVGTKTAVYVGNFTRDYCDITVRDPETAPLYFATGTGQSMLSNRLSYFFDLKGPSITVDTACSSSLVALHLACQSLRTGESDQAIVGGTNLIFSPHIMTTMSSLGFLSSDGRSYTSDHRACGYGRGEGFATVILKPLDAALRDKNPIRAIIRGTAINSDGRTTGITLPSRESQVEMIRSAYADAGLDPRDTGYFEAHGTGTQAGDPIEMSAIHEVFASSRSSDDPLIVGSIKTNIGHLEGASGLAGLIKAVLCLEKGVIPPNINFEKPNNEIPLEEWNLKIPTTLEQWPHRALRRASVNSFGYGGTNAHVILDEAKGYLNSLSRRPSRDSSIAVPTSTNETGRHSEFYRSFVFSANDDIASSKLVDRMLEYLKLQLHQDEQTFLGDLAFTLSEKRTRLPLKLAVSASSISELVGELERRNAFRKSFQAPRLGFVFTGQGAQWARMGVELEGVYEAFDNSLLRCEATLVSLGCPWRLLDELHRDEHSSKINNPGLSQPICTAIQIALVDLLCSWGVEPAAVVGHSSGEIAAAYAAGALSLESAMAVAYYRGLLCSQMAARGTRDGGMIAVGLSAPETKSFISQIEGGRLNIACYNSPQSVTVAGDRCAITKLEQLLIAKKIFVRRLKVDVAYHSHHMQDIAPRYSELLQNLQVQHSDGIQFFSSVSGSLMECGNLVGDYWVRNMVSPVLFSSALRKMCLGSETGTQDKTNVDLLIEIGPHAALAGPIKQILDDTDSKSDIPYISCLLRKKNAVKTMHDVANSLFMNGSAVDFCSVNASVADNEPQVLADLPPYQWNHSTGYWHESRISRGHRFRRYGRRDLIGAPEDNLNPREPRWRGFLRLSELPWIKDHQVQGKTIYPAAGMLSMVIEAMQQISDRSSETLKGVRFRDINIGQALVVPDSSDGIETVLSLHPSSILSSADSSSPWFEFRLYSVVSEEWIEHCHGYVCATPSSQVGEVNNQEARQKQRAIEELFTTYGQQCQKVINVERLYKTLDHVGLCYGPSFQNLIMVYASGTDNKALGTVSIPDTARFMPQNFEFPHILHPATLDSVFHTLFPAFSNDQNGLQHPFVPTFIKQMKVSTSGLNVPSKKLKVACSVLQNNFRQIDSKITAVADGCANIDPLIEVEGLRCSAIANMASAASSITEDRKLCFKEVWSEDLDLACPADIKHIFHPPEHDQALSEIVATFEAASLVFIRRALSEIKATDFEKMKPHCQFLYQTLRQIIEKAQRGDLGHQALHWLAASEKEEERLISSARTHGAEGKMLCRMGENLTRIMRNETEALPVMLEGDLLYELYSTGLGTERSFEQLSSVIGKLAHKKPDMNILEIGAGTGGATMSILRTLGGAENEYPRFCHFDFTDISQGFFEKAREKFRPWAALMDFKKLDIEVDPQSQGFSAGSYDLIIAVNVLHATSEMKNTLQNVRRLLKPGGRLVLMEITHPLLRTIILYGGLPGWWSGVNDGRTSGPTITEDEWHALLKNTSFSGVDICLRDFPNEADYLYSVMVSTAVEDAESRYPDAVIIDTCRQSYVSAEYLQNSLQTSCGIKSELFNLDAPTQTYHNKVCIVLDELRRPILRGADSAKYERIRQVISSSKGVIWVTRGATIESSKPESSLIYGLLRSVRSEDQSKRIVTLDFDSENVLPAQQAAESILRIFQKSFREGQQLEDTDLEFSERSGRLMIPRIVEDRFGNDYLAKGPQDSTTEMVIFEESERPLKLEIGTPGLLDTLRFIEDSKMTEKLPDDEVEIRVEASGINFSDVMVAMGQHIENFLGCECSGILTKVGARVTHLKEGDRVCTLALGTLKTHVRCRADLVQRIPDDMTFDVAASLPAVYCTAYLSLIDTARLQKDETILIHAAAGGVGQAAIKLAQMIGAEIFVTVGTVEKKQFIMQTYGIPEDHIFSSRDASFAEGVLRMTNGKGVDVILNSLAGELLRESWNCIARFGRFVEIGKRDFLGNSKLEMEPFIRNVSFSSVDLTGIFRHRPELGSSLLAKVMGLVRSGAVTPVTPITTYAISRVEEALRTMQAGKHLGKVVITRHSRDPVKVISKRAMNHTFKENASYIIVGGLGGLGRSISRWMVDRGAKNVIFLSRSGAANPEAANFVDELRREGVNVVVFACDVSKLSQLAKVVESCAEQLPPIRGIIHAGMVLQDSIFASMSYEKFQAAVKPKVTGSLNLHMLSIVMNWDLDFFVMLSSAAGIVGNSSQSNYTAGCVFQDALARHRNANGLPAVSLDLGRILSVGAVAKNQNYASNLERWGFTNISEGEFHSLLELAIFESRQIPESSQIITGLDTQRLIASRTSGDTKDTPLWFRDPRFSHLMQTGQDKGTEDIQKAKSVASLRESIEASTTYPDVIRVITEAITTKLAKMLTLPAENIDPSRSPAAYGVDSLVAVELRNWLYQEAKYDVPIFDILSKSSLTALAKHVALKSNLLSEELREEAEKDAGE